MKPTKIKIKIKLVGYYSFLTKKVYKTKYLLKQAQQLLKIQREKIIKAMFLKQISLAVKLEKALNKAKRLKGFFKFSKVRVLQTQIKQLNILYPKWAQLSF